MEPISAAILAGSELLSGLISSHFIGAAGEESAAAQREAQRLNMSLAEREMEESTRRFDLQQALEKMKYRLYKENQDWTKEQTEAKRQEEQALNFSNRLVGLSNSANLRGQGLASSWATQARL